MNLQLPTRINLAALARFAREQGCQLVAGEHGDLIMRPLGQGNANVVKFPRRQRQYVGSDLPDGPEAA